MDNINLKVEAAHSSKRTSSLKHNGSTDSKLKQVKIKTEPMIPLMRSRVPTSDSTSKSNKYKSSTAVPSTPATKIIEKPAMKEIDTHQRIIDRSAKFFLKTVDMNSVESKANQIDDSIIKSMDGTDTSIALETMNETPTRKKSKSQETGQNNRIQDQQLPPKKKVKLDVISDSSTPIISRISKDRQMGESKELVATASHHEKSTKSNKSNKTVAPKAPPVFQPVSTSLLENIPKELNSIDFTYRNVEDANIRKQYSDISQLNYNEWCEMGFQIVDRQSELVKRIILTRSELSYEFNIIFKIINKYGESLEKNDDDLNSKMQQLQKLGEDIKKFIN